ncbi:hypothetical protein GIB67_031489 [Kingdonia uniflora]|uniref:Uncharacterized protein n=1 Tax=Kingdonia uniflora TaxID=39325 RepID=A0A7J7MNT7_9MAGN|nr:hypothetical protein GIB67_031489 [Kingdonia uniflora]
MLIALTLYFEVEVDSERGLKEDYVEFFKERGLVSDPARVIFLAQEARNRHSLEARKYSARAGVYIVWGDVEHLSDLFGFIKNEGRDGERTRHWSSIVQGSIEEKGSSRQASQQGVKLTSARVRILELLTDLDEEGKNVIDLQFQVNVLKVEAADTRARASKYEVLWLVVDILIKKMEGAHNRQNKNINTAWNKVVTLEHTIQGLKLNAFEHLDENAKLRDANTKLDADLFQAKIRLDERRVEWENRKAELDGSMSLIYHMDEFMIVLESRNSAVLDKKRRVEKQCKHLKTSLQEAQTKLSEHIMSKQVKTEASGVHEIDMTTVISFFA